MASKFQEFIINPDSRVDPVVEEVPEIKEQEAAPIKVTGKKPANRLLNIGQQLDALMQLMKKAEARFDDITRSGLKALVETFPTKRTSIQKVVLPKQLVDFYGGDASKLEFGAQTIKSEAQYEKLKRDVEMAKKYFGEHIEVHRIEYPNGRPPVAVVMGVNAEAFNAVISAARQQAQLEAALSLEKQAMMKEAPGHAQENAQNLDKASQMVIATNRSPQVEASLAFANAQKKETGREL